MDEGEKEDLFHHVLNLEDHFTKEGIAKGSVDGKKLGSVEGFALGVQKGDELGAEIGYYCGNVLLFNMLGGDHAQLFNARANKTIQQLDSALKNFSLEMDPTNPELQESFDRITGKWKQLQANLQTSQTNQIQTNPLNF